MIQLTRRETAAKEYGNALKERYKSMPEIRKIDKSRKMPKAITNATKKKKVMLDSRKKKEENRRKHSAPGAVPFTSARKKNILDVLE